VAFIQFGSGRPILEARCFFVSDGGQIEAIGGFRPDVSDTRLEISAKSCG